MSMIVTGGWGGGDQFKNESALTLDLFVDPLHFPRNVIFGVPAPDEFHDEVQQCPFGEKGGLLC